MAADNSQTFPELFFPDDARWASRAAARGEIRRLARGLYTPNLDEPAEQLIRRRWYDAAALYFPNRKAIGSARRSDAATSQICRGLA